MSIHRFIQIRLVVCAFGSAASVAMGSDDGRSDGGTGAEPLAETFIVSESSGAACLDGSLPRYWLQPATVSTDVNRWVMHMQGGGWW